MDQKSYSNISLVCNKTKDGITGKGIQICKRSRTNPMLPKMIPESEFYYLTKAKTILINDEEGIKTYLDSIKDQGATPEIVEESFNRGLEEYNKIQQRPRV
jgi:hypothetical protein